MRMNSSGTCQLCFKHKQNLLPCCCSLFHVWDTAVVQDAQFCGTVALLDSAHPQQWHFLYLCWCVPAYRVESDLLWQRAETGPGCTLGSWWESLLIHWSWMIPAHLYSSYSLQQQCLSYLSMFLSLWSLTFSGLHKPADSIDWIEQSMLFAEQQTWQPEGRFPKVAHGLLWYS